MSAPQRVVSLVPSLTELVYSLGCGGTLVGRTRFCTEPAGEVDAVAIVGGTKNPSIEKIVAAAPDLVIANKEENRREDVESLRSAELEVLLTDPNDVEGALRMVADVGAALGATESATRLITEVEAALAEASPRQDLLRVFVPIWYNPLMALGTGTYGSDLLARCGGTNVIQQPRYPETTLDEVTALSPDLILLPDEPFPFDGQHLSTFERVAPTRLVDGKLVWWYGPRMPGAIRELAALFENARAQSSTGGLLQ